MSTVKNPSMETGALNKAMPDWLAALPSEDGFVHISQPRRFQHDETAYDQQYKNDPANMSVGKGVVELVRREQAQFNGPALEVGCGTGLVSLGLAAHSPYPLTVLTDPSPAFLDLTRAKMRAHGVDESRVCYAVLMGEELNRVPASEFSLIVLRSTLHHVLDVQEFIAAAAKALRPGGILTFQEPCMEGYVLMGAMVQFLPVLARAGGVELHPEQAKKADEFAASMRNYARRDIDKTRMEDKHLFRVDELMAIGRGVGLTVDFKANRTYDAYALHAEPPGDKFAAFFRSYARYCMSWDEAMMGLWDRFLAPYCDFVEAAAQGGSGPYMHGVFICRKTG